jgi:hypothetical protein
MIATTATKPSDYLHIVALGRSLGSFGYYITAQQEKAFAAKAPIDAVSEVHAEGAVPSYCSPAGNWKTVNDLDPEYRDMLNREVEYMKELLVEEAEKTRKASLKLSAI